MSSSKEQADLVTVAIADSTRIHTQLLADALHKDLSLRVVASSPTSNGLLADITRVPIDVAIVSYNLDDQPNRGIELIREMRNLRPHIKTIVLLDSSRPQDIVESFRAGAKGVFCRNERLESLSKCIHTVHEGQIWARSADLDLALEALANSPVVRTTNQRGLELLSARERQVVQYLAAGMTNNEIAESLKLSRHTIKNYLFRIFDKLGVSNRTELLCLTLNNIRAAASACICGEEDHFSCVLEAAKSGLLSAQVRLAEQFSKVDGQPPDLVSAYMWYLVAERNARSMYERIQGGKTRVVVAMPLRQRAEAEQKAAEWLETKKKKSVSAAIDEASQEELAGAN